MSNNFGIFVIWRHNTMSYNMFRLTSPAKAVIVYLIIIRTNKGLIMA